MSPQLCNLSLNGNQSNLTMTGLTKEQLIELLLHKPLEFEGIDGVKKLVNIGITFDEVRDLVRRIYDMSESQLKTASNANAGILGKLNRRSSKRRKKRYNKKVESPVSGKPVYRIYAEGDSWFQFPTFIKDIIDWLNKEDEFLVYSEAYGGDWITNIIYEGQYIPSLSVHAPDFFLISGGGNDLVGDNRLALMVTPTDGYIKYQKIEDIQSPILAESQKEQILLAQPYITKEFYAFLNVMKLQYTLIFDNLYKPNSKHKDIITITQGYDYPFPSPKAHWSLCYPLQPLLNRMLDSGKWLYRPLMIKGILDEKIQRALLLTFIFEFNETLSSFASGNDYEKVFHIDCRGIAPNPRQWYDELHLKGKYFKQVTKVYKEIILNHKNYKDRVIRVIDFLNLSHRE